MVAVHHVDIDRVSRLGDENGHKGPLILFVDDDPHLVSSVQRNMRPYRVRLDVAYHGMQGVMNAVEIRPDVIVTDLQMPFASGDELVTLLSRHPATVGVPILIVTGRSGVTLTSRYRRLGVKSVLAKPLRFEDLLSELKSIINIEPRDGSSSSIGPSAAD